MKVHFESDYIAGAHPRVMEALLATNAEATPGYGADPYCEHAKELIRKAINNENAEIFFTVGGTQTNALVIDALLRPQQCVVAADSGHINVHEAGAVEATGHKVWGIPSADGKLSASILKKHLSDFYADDTWPHMPIPGMVYISFPTELGTLYSKKELVELKAVCQSYKLPLYIDGARLGYGLASPACDLDLKEIAEIADAFYIGGTKQGLLFGEAIVAKPGLLPQFFTLMKQHGAVLAKGRLLGVQFSALMEGGLYMQISAHAVELALKLREGFEARGYTPAIDSMTNQQFFTLPNSLIDRLQEVAGFEYWGPRGEVESTVRFVTGWSTTERDVLTLLADQDGDNK